MPNSKSEAQANTDKINAALKIIESKPPKAKLKGEANLEVYTLEDGRRVSTKERVIKNVAPITSKIPTDEELFDKKTDYPTMSF